jgi:hypothetical protein
MGTAEFPGGVTVIDPQPFASVDTPVLVKVKTEANRR